MKTHRMYRRQSRPEVPNILVLKPGVNYVPAKYLESLEATSEIKRQRLMFGTWVNEPSRRFVLNGFDQHGNPVSEIVNVPMFDETPVQSEHSYSVLSGDPYKAPEQCDHQVDATHCAMHVVSGEGVLARPDGIEQSEDYYRLMSGTNLIPRQPGPETTVENWQALYDIGVSPAERGELKHE